MPSRTRPLMSTRHQSGVVLIIALVMLVVISLLATLSVRSALSSESVSGNVRTTSLAGQSAEVALRYCEDRIVANVRTATALPISGVDVPAGWPALAVQNYQTPPLGVDTANWDGARTGVFVLPSAAVNQAAVTFRRMPECMAERVPVVNSTSTGLNNASTYLITARGFGPEVAACDPTLVPPAAGSCTRPDGTEVFLQSTLEID